MKLSQVFVVLLLLASGCIGTAGPNQSTTNGSEQNGTEASLQSQPVNLTRVQESWELAWSQVRANEGETTDSNCIALGNTSASFEIHRGWVNVTWNPGEPNTTDETQWMIRGGEGLDRYENRTRIGPGEHARNVSGWNLTNPERRVSLLVGFESPEPAYVGVENRAKITVDWHVDGSYETFLVGSCTRG